MKIKLGQLWAANKKGIRTTHPSLVVVIGISPTDEHYNGLRIKIADFLSPSKHLGIKSLLSEDFLNYFELEEEPVETTIKIFDVLGKKFMFKSKTELEALTYEATNI